MKSEKADRKNVFPFSVPGLQINGLGCSLVRAPGEVDLPEGMDDYLLMFLHDSLYIEDADGWLWREAPCLMIWARRSRIHFERQDRAWKHSWIDGDGSFLRRQIKAFGIPVGRVIRLPDVFSTEKYLLDLRHELAGQEKPHPLIVRNILQNLLLEVQRTAHAGERNLLVPRIFMDARAFLKLNSGQPLRIADVARRYNLSVPYFCRQFRRYFDVSALEYLTQVRMEQAEAILRDHQLNVSQVAVAVGYADPDQFSRIFKRYYGIRPSDIHRWAANNLPGKRPHAAPWERRN